MRLLSIMLIGILSFSCSNRTEVAIPVKSETWSEEKQLEENASHASQRMRYKLIQSKYMPKSEVWNDVYKDMYTADGEPKAMTFIGQRFEEKKLLQIGSAFERTFRFRKVPGGY